MKKKDYIQPLLTVDNIGSLQVQMLGELLGSPTNNEPGMQHMPRKQWTKVF